MTKKDYFEVNQKRSFWFIAFLVLMAGMLLGLLYRAVLFFQIQNDFENIPAYYAWLSVVFIGLSLMGLPLIYFLRKIGVYLVPIGLMGLIMVQPGFSISGSVTAVFSLFFYAVFGLLTIIPRWKLFK